MKHIQMHQSPINIKDTEAQYSERVNLEINYNPVKVNADHKHPGQLILDVQNLGSLQIQTPKFAKPLKYIAREVHFNGPSEHKLDGNRTDMEMQIFHQVENGAIPENDHDTPHFAVIGVLYKKDDTAKTSTFLQNLTQEGNEVDFQKNLFSKYHDFYYYKGTHSAPPAVDFVHWFVLNKILPISGDKINFLHHHWHDSHGFTNYRITQPLYGRQVYKTFK